MGQLHPGRLRDGRHRAGDDPVRERLAAERGNGGVARLRAAVDAGAVDIYVTDPAVDITTLSSPTFTFAASSSVQESSFLSFTPGTYRVRVTAAGNTTDLRLDIPSITLASQQVATVVLTPTTGGTLVNGALILQQGAYTASRNTNARVRLAAAVTPGATVSASVGATPIAAGAVAPTVGAYVVVPAATTIDVSVNGTVIASPAATPAAGTDATLSVYGNAGAATATLLADDNRLPAAATNLKMRLYNGLTGTPAPLTLTADFSLVASNVQPGAASGYAVIPSSSSMRLDVTAGSTALTPQTNLNVPGNAVYTLFMLGSSGSRRTRSDRPVRASAPKPAPPSPRRRRRRDRRASPRPRAASLRWSVQVPAAAPLQRRLRRGGVGRRDRAGSRQAPPAAGCGAAAGCARSAAGPGAPAARARGRRAACRPNDAVEPAAGEGEEDQVGDEQQPAPAPSA